MTKQEIINYVMTTPSNPNKAVLEGMLDSFSGGESGGGSSRVLLYENDAMEISKDGVPSIKYINEDIWLNLESYWTINSTYSLEIDGMVAITGAFVKPAGESAYHLGLTSPGDSTGLTNYSAGLTPTTTGTSSQEIINGFSWIIIDSSKYPGTTHSVKIYKEA